MSEVQCSNEHRPVKNCKQLNLEPQFGEKLVRTIVNNLDNMWVTLCNLDIVAECVAHNKYVLYNLTSL